MSPRLFIFTEGMSEVNYFEMFRKRGMRFSIITIKSADTDVEGIVRFCIRELRCRGFGEVRGDRAAIVFDVDRNTSERIMRAGQSAEDASMVMSNPSFEYWLLLHFTDSTKAMTQDDLEEALSGHLGRRYRKGEDYSRILTTDRVVLAVSRAEKRLPVSECTLEHCLRLYPSTMLHVLVSDLLNMQDEAGK